MVTALSAVNSMHLKWTPRSWSHRLHVRSSPRGLTMRNVSAHPIQCGFLKLTRHYGTESVLHELNETNEGGRGVSNYSVRLSIV